MCGTTKARSLLFALCCACLSAAFPSGARAWGAEGHRITGLIAYELLSPRARAAVRHYLGSDDLAGAAVWMDEQRPALAQQFPHSPSWHYDNVPVCPHAAPAAHICPDGNCASAQIETFGRILADNAATHDDRALALRLVVHMVGDIHQPLHAADNHDRGGNRIAIRLSSGDANLHYAWDAVFVKAALRGMGEKEFADSLVTAHRADIEGWAKGEVQDWIAESNRLAATKVYGGLAGFACPAPTADSLQTLDTAYHDEAAKVVRLQLARAGVRIAAVLNRAFSGFVPPRSP